MKVNNLIVDRWLNILASAVVSQTALLLSAQR